MFQRHGIPLQVDEFYATQFKLVRLTISMTVQGLVAGIVIGILLDRAMKVKASKNDHPISTN